MSGEQNEWPAAYALVVAYRVNERHEEYPLQPQLAGGAAGGAARGRGAHARQVGVAWTRRRSGIRCCSEDVGVAEGRGAADRKRVWQERSG